MWFSFLLKKCSFYTVFSVSLPELFWTINVQLLNFLSKIPPVIDTNFKNFRKILKFTIKYRCKIHNFTKSSKSENSETQFCRFSDFLCLCSRGTLDQKKKIYMEWYFFFFFWFFFFFFLKIFFKFFCFFFFFLSCIFSSRVYATRKLQKLQSPVGDCNFEAGKT